ncbi:MAG: ParB/RepB/Spo0J family partition protein [Spirochaetales bacterium]|nr:ParB/RepB/Spo0J family partition protein [Spirochaetales bacterium]
MARKGLGKGLSNLLPGSEGRAAIEIKKHPEYQELSPAVIVPNPDQPRKRFSAAEIDELVKTLFSVGLIEPIIVRPLGDKFQLISGERRWIACKKAGFKSIPAIVKKVNDLQALEMGIIENIQREELTPMEEARAYEKLLGHDLKPQDIAEKVGKDRSTVTNLLRLLKLPEEIQNLIDQKKLTAGQARPLLAIADRRLLLRLATRIVSEGWSARRVEDEVARLQSGPATKKVAGRKDPNLLSVEKKLQNRFSTRVEIAHRRNGGGKVSLRYATLEDLDRMLQLMGVK